MKRLLALLLTAGLTIGLTGCGPEQGEAFLPGEFRGGEFQPGAVAA